ncbi:MAG: hypothetical protein A3J62_03100 [Candidatus Buchananbacteria bacterium RIFCSPHIGHO2_02_FULL_38_8]|uniref:Uncharacterized protein n=2 Tax=Candidatus Buchananiibacteriota TaxID=1817903 RepID=A0A1G1XXU5_9BACT|nr:MAG: hypothetical protein A2731_01010 [Candidatus Buchananbacteria bacterium RIFCSPHIGHO2_01_FULL_39_8]OGY47252.1 MAG: hypothetical protein A3J62_03100 [Candidatus Buchananbacteria bacterium RIFCSPHIGHO2_02_FULL_38_8]
MLLEKKYYIIPLTFLINIVLLLYDFFLFKTWLYFGFLIHNLLAFLVGFLLLYFSSKLLKKDSANKNFLYIGIFVGFTIAVIHFTKIILYSLS